MPQEGINNLKKQFPNLKGIEFYVADYKDLSFKDCVIYCDPPYEGTTGYSKFKIDYTEFYNWCRKQSKYNIVLVSGYTAPADFTLLWEKECVVGLRSDRLVASPRIERLYKC